MTNLICFLLVVPFAALAQPPLTTAQIAKKVSPSVVVIQGKTDAGDVLGSGFIISKDGEIVTNLHVIRDMKAASVQTRTGEIFDSMSVLATDERRDLAIVRVAGFNLPVLDLGDSDTLTVGEPIVMVGSPNGLEGTVTAGILSSVRDTGDGYKVLQTDAAMNPGNSGGPFVNNKGQAIGVASFKLRTTEGLNFAIPINYVRGLLNNLHEPRTLEQTRAGSSSMSRGNNQSTGSSIKETRDWLKEKLPLGSVRYQRRMKLQGTPADLVSSIVEEPTVVSLDSCTAVFGRQIILTIPDHPEVRSPIMAASILYTVPLGALTKGLTVRMENIWDGVLSGVSEIAEPQQKVESEFVTGDRWSYRVILTSEAANITIATTTTGFESKTVNRDAVYLTFNDEALARNVQDAFLQVAAACRNTDANTTKILPNSSGPSLIETLDWLKEKIPLGSVNYTTDTALSVNERSAVFSLDSCTCIFGAVFTGTYVGDQHQYVGSNRYTILLGSIAEAFVDHIENDIGHVIGGDKWAYRLVLKSKANDISLASYGINSAVPVTTTTNWLFLKFNDESIAQRAARAFGHAAELCRKGRPEEPF